MDRETRKEFRRLWTEQAKTNETLIRMEGNIKSLHAKVRAREQSRLWRNTQLAGGAALIASDIAVHFMK